MLTSAFIRWSNNFIFFCVLTALAVAISEKIPRNISYEKAAEISEGLCGGDIRNITIKLGLQLLVGKAKAIDEEILKEEIDKTRIEQDGYSVLGSRLVLDNEKDLMEIKTYSQKGEKSFVNTVSAKVKKVRNIPADILDEIKSKGSVEISLKFDD